MQDMPCVVLRKAATSLTVLAQVPARAQSFSLHDAGHRKDTTLLLSCSTNPTLTPWQAQQRAGCSTQLLLCPDFPDLKAPFLWCTTPTAGHIMSCSMCA